MPRWELVTSWILRLAMLATAIVYVVIGDWAVAVFCVIALALTVTPSIVARTAKFTWPIEVELVLLWLLTAHLMLGRMFGLYTSIEWFDKALHFSDSALLGFMAFFAVYVSHYLRHERPHPWIDGIAILLATLGLGAFWEIVEFCEDQLLGMHAQGSPTLAPLPDTMWDLIADGVGGIIAGVLGPVFMHHSRRSRERVAEFVRRVEQRRGATP